MDSLWSNIIIAAVLVVLVGVAVFILLRARKSHKCVGCPCSGKASCHCHAKGTPNK